MTQALPIGDFGSFLQSWQSAWQWVAGSGTDAAPLQGEKFDPYGTYVRRYVPELAAMPDTWIH